MCKGAHVKGDRKGIKPGTGTTQFKRHIAQTALVLMLQIDPAE